jgi:ketosteroid isomerase-like protein
MSMKKGILVLAALAALVPSARADDAQKAIQAQYDKRSAAAAKKDVEGSVAINAPEFVAIGLKNDKRTTAQIKPQLTQVFASIKSYTITTKITKCVVKGDSATVTTQDAVVVVGKGTQESEATSEDTWIKKGAQWLRTQNKLLTSKIKSNKPGN